MNNIKYNFYHKDLHHLSDITFRKLLKRISKAIREIHYQEVLMLIEYSDASKSEKQSMIDKLKAPAYHVESYYIKEIRRGSVEIQIIASAFLIFLLQQTVGESIKEAWVKTRFHQLLVDYFSTDLRKKEIDRSIERVLGSWRFDRYLINDIEKSIDDEGDIEVKINLSSNHEVEEKLKTHSLPTAESVVRRSQLEIIRINNTLDNMDIFDSDKYEDYDE